jgi:multiple sugar transport system substrate-binding protein
MLPEQRSALDEIITKVRSGRMSRRTFLHVLAGVGLSSASALSLLESCAGSSSTHDNTIYLVWQSEYDLSNAYQQLVDRFNQTNRDNIHVILRIGPAGTSDLMTIERDMLQARSSAVDIFSVDIIYVAELAQQQWIQPISESLWPASERAKYLPGPIQACTLDGQIWAAPFRTDLGLIYYRTDIIKTVPPKTWEELTSTVETVLDPPQMYGYVWEGAQYEGLVCNFDEVLHGYGGSILDPHDPTKVTVDSPEAEQALTTMVNWIWTSKISPPDTSTYTEEVARKTWEDGHTVFMRNWPYAYSSGNDPSQSKIVGKFDIHPMLYGGNNTVGHSSIGGWQLAINSFINPDKQAAAWKFIQYMLGPEAQKIGATRASWTVTLESLYADPEVLSKVPLFKQLKPILQTAVPRPVTPNYNAVSTAIRLRVRQALARKLPVSEALKALAFDLAPLVAKPNQASE